MAIGYFIRLGDKTTCGGEVLEADTRITMLGMAHAREGDRVSCGINGETYTIEGGVSFFNSNGRLAAGSLDSLSGCPCKAELIPSVLTNKYESRNDAAPQTTRAVAQPDTAFASSPPAPRSSGFASASSTPRSVPLGSATAEEPGFYIVPKSTTREQLEADLFTLRDPTVMGKFKLLNPYRHEVKAGSMIVLSDPSNYQCTLEEALLMGVAARTNQILETLSPEEADFMVQHREVIQSFLTYGSQAVGVGASVFKNNLDNVSDTLKKIEALHQHSFLRDGHLSSPTFLAERQKLFATLDVHMTILTRKGIGFPHHPDLNRALFLSPPSLVHRWTEAGGVGQMPGYATHFDGVARASKYVQYGGWVGTAIGGGVSAMKVQDVCRAGSTEACKRVKFTEAGSFVGAIGGSALVGSMAVPLMSGLCVVFTVPTAGFAPLACSILVAGIGSYVGGELGSSFGEFFGDEIYEVVK
ncbi:PAAR domain-containing protein [Pseudomonas vancouverensis]|uniref:PAAR domain-containing protein n=1 Tax=Pseudomonas vancouverensis TaxID=95300 RepID=A0A1H2MJI8_PSEVA|nr:PAAR domain-containing protein [Pseudomonas vancouverensis]KAB0494796.1 PAAR domain-containing protein [Pseudomonas vancouverensis]TDB63562.1 PAAR domain-containing protein [Pseudomonas vancouverensis]SDU93292.1 PAAR motif-containing protein [Pseudomonas vancouverensis]